MGVVVDPVLELGLGGFPTELEAAPPVLEPVLEPRLGGFPTELDAAPTDPVRELGLWGYPTELDAEPTPGGSCPADGGAEYAVSASKPGILGVKQPSKPLLTKTESRPLPPHADGPPL